MDEIMADDYTQNVDYNWWLIRLDTQLNEPTNQSLVKVPKVVDPTNKKWVTYFDTKINTPIFN